ncbi:NAD(P)-dependent oxidoreductase [Pontivivens insulae]|uniref:2-hydroxy-3-oxopropionate reductase n=1 Tax=Pontivivens insulae TaxID=1639689 RepID=A0A2R8A7Z1_9RHOB|nr:NAD(P)-dependent oxidoreductase [Pontivivens insulae]RED18418.1 2-hydroxy-3-oxopropionate reductase [Pontivivens insulae]SPF28316.1 2-hydroxy-3-oxopropionate reductase [Pontivivens insulae]
MHIAVLGTGLMGAPMVRRLADAGHVLHVWNRSAEGSAPLAQIAKVHPSAASAVVDTEIVISMLLDGPVTKLVLDGQGVIDNMAHGSILIDMASVEPDTDQGLAAQAMERGVNYLDAPVSGGVVGATEGTLSIFVGGEVAILARALPVLNLLGRPTHVGPLGAGQTVKLANQLIVGATIAAVSEGLRLAEAAGCDTGTVRTALQGGFADSRILDLHGARMVSGDFTPGARSAVQLKDLNNALKFAQAQGLDLPLSQTAQEGYRSLVEDHSGAELDHAAYFKWLKLRDGSR